MATKQPLRVSDGCLNLEAGMNSGIAPNLIPKNQVAFAVNTTFRNAWPYPRPGFRKVPLNFNGDEDVELAFRQALFQTGDGYVSDDGSGAAISMHGGRVFRVNVADFAVQEITIAGDPNPSMRPLAWTVQAENYFIIQDGQSKPFIYNGGSSVRAVEGQKQIPVGRQMAYYMGRIWIANGREYLAGDIIYNPDSGSSALGFRDSILYVKENDYLNEGGSFNVPYQSGDIVALRPIANINTALGQGELIAITQNSVFATLVPQDRAQWKNTTNPLQRMIQLTNGGYSQASVVNVNEDLFYRSPNGIVSLKYSVRNDNEWGNTPISNEVIEILSKDPDAFLQYASGVEFDNRLLMTTSPAISQGRGVYHRGLVSLDFNLITNMQGKSPPAWEGVWTGLNFLKVFTVLHNNVKRCFAYVLNSSAEIEMWEITKDDQADSDERNVQTPIQWSLNTRSMDFGSKFDMKNLFSGDFFMDEVSGEFELSLLYRPDGYPCWVPWYSTTGCAKTSLCGDDLTGACVTLPNFQPQYRPYLQMTQPKDDFDPITKKLMRVGFEFQFRFENKGYFRMKQFRVDCLEYQQLPYGSQL